MSTSSSSHTKSLDADESLRRLLALGLGALGVVYGDIGTSPLYAIRECFNGKHAIPVDAVNLYGTLSLVFWALAMVVTLKYVLFILRADNQGEGGIFALLRLLPAAGKGMGLKLHGLVILAGIFGAALLFGDAIITPSISVLSAVEGLEMASKAMARWAVPLTCAILFGLFMIQKRGTEGIGKLFGPIMLVWFVIIGILGLISIVQTPRILAAIYPGYAVRFFLQNHWHGFLILGSVVLCITGGEAMYADLGHFNKPSIRLSWIGFVWPMLMLNYFGQGAFLLRSPDQTFHPFYSIAPRGLLYPYVALATMATIIASQAMISAMFSLSQQAVQLGFMPRLAVVHTSGEVRGQIYMPWVNWVLMVACLSVVLGFQSSTRLAGAYGIAVTGTMGLTSFIFYFVMTRHFHWAKWKAAILVGLFLLFDLSFLGANLLKIKDGGWLPLVVASGMTLIMLTWRDGRAHLAGRFAQRMPDALFIEDVKQSKPQRIPGVGVFLSASPVGMPVTLLHHYKFNRVFHERVVILSTLTRDQPVVKRKDRLEIDELGEGFYRLRAYFGFMEKPSIKEILALAKDQGFEIDPVAYYIGHETLVVEGDTKMASWRKRLFAFMSRNALNPTTYFGLPPEKVIELGVRVKF